MLIRLTGRLVAGLICVATVAADELVRYDGERVVRVQIQEESQIPLVESLTDDIWSHGIGVGPVDIRVTPEQFEQLQQSGLAFEVLIEDLQTLVDRERMGERGEGDFDDYLPLADVLAFLDELVTARPDMAETFVVGQSIEGRDIVGIRIHAPNSSGKPAVLYHGCQHAREWITVPTVLWIAEKLVKGYDTDPVIKAVLDRSEWMLVPVFNPDGYEYTWTKDRLWRKNRRKNDNGTYGVDNNRNWGYQWGSENGSSGDPGDATYRGKSAFSEPETTAMADLVRNTPNLVAYCDIHSYSQLVMWPWGYTSELPPDQEEYSLIGETMVDLIRDVHGKEYTPGPIYSTIYPVSGGSVDWVYGDQGRNAFTYELRDTGNFGFVLPKEQIIPQCEEVFPALLFYGDFRSQPLRISFPDGLPPYLPPGQKNTLRVRVTPGLEESGPAKPKLYVRKAGVDRFDAIELEDLGDGDFVATFPARACGAPTEFYIAAVGAGGTPITSPVGAPQLFYTTPIGSPAYVFRDDFENDLAWTVKNENVSFGSWTRVDPIGTSRSGTPVQPEDDNPEGTGTLCYVTGQGRRGDPASAGDLDGGPTRLISTRLDLSEYDVAYLDFYRWLYSDSQTENGRDALFVELSSDDGTTWISAAKFEHAPEWLTGQVSIGDFVNLNSTVRVRFSIADNPNDGVTDAGIDDVVVWGLECINAPLPGDMNCDGTVDFDDIDGFVAAVTSREQYEEQYTECNYLNADVNGDSSVDFNDIDPFVELLL